LADILDEVEEDLRRDRMMRLWQRFGWILGAVALAVVVGIGGWRIWQWRDLNQREAASGQFLAAARAADPRGQVGGAPRDLGAARQGFEALATDGPRGYATLARLRAAALAAEAGDATRAVELWRAVAADGSAETLLRDLARLSVIRARIGEGDPAELGRELVPLAAPGAAFRTPALELQALLAEKRGDRSEAVARLQELANDPGAPSSLRSRAGELLARLGG